ncbi:MAG: hypothetical protein JSS27_14605 [Planctomycetes bacterium]|nr:hypothetical protein [Planctomycetota bacterium]
MPPATVEAPKRPAAPSAPVAPSVPTAAGAPKHDPNAKHQPLFVDWPKPDVAILITGEQMGYIEPCGCAGLENQKGGLSRRHTLVKQLAEKGWPVLPVDLGETIKRFGLQQEIKFQTAVESLRAIGYEAVGWGPDDLRLPAGVLASSVAETDGSPSRFVAANVGLFAIDSGLTSRYRVVERGGRKLGVTAVLTDKLQKDVNNEDVKFVAAETALDEVTPKLAAESDFRILLCYGEPEEAARLAKKYPQYQVVVTAHGASEPPAEPNRIEGTETLLIEVGHKGMFGIVLGLYADKAAPVRYQRVPIDDRFVDSAEMQKLKENYQQQLKTLGWEGLGLRPKAFPRASGPTDPNGQFVGSKACAECHPTAYGIWAETPHAHATETLAKLTPARQFDPECISCHATGWNPQEFFPYASGFVGMDQTPHLMGNGCENCHGPGAGHVAAERGSDAALRDVGRDRMKITVQLAKDKACAACHDLDNSPEFDFSTYWPQVEHKGKK